MANPKKADRNRELIKKRKKGWSYRKIAHQYNLDVKTVFNVIKRDMLVVVDKSV